jgi:lipid-A-disaccharide synthase
MPRIAIVAGEASGDYLAAHLIRAVTSADPTVRFYGIAGPRMQAAGCESLFPQEPLAVRGYVEVLKNLSEILAIKRGLIRALKADPPDLFIGVDAPDFNLGVETILRHERIRTAHYVSPSIWAWRPERITRIKAACDKMLTIFPFEAEIYHRAGVAVAYTGHPMADEVPTLTQRDARAQLRLRANAPIFLLMPGSRQSELAAHAGVFLAAAKQIRQALPEAEFLVPLATRETRDLFANAIHDHDAADVPITTLFGHAQLAMAACDVALIASGTATLEAALMRCPMVIAYRMPALSWRIMKKKALIPYVGLPNILAGDFIVPELLQDDATADNLAQAVLAWYRTPAARDALKARFETMHTSLKRNSSARLAEEVLGMLGRAPRVLNANAVNATGSLDVVKPAEARGR